MSRRNQWRFQWLFPDGRPLPDDRGARNVVELSLAPAAAPAP